MALTNSTNNDLQFANQPAAGRWTATPEPGAAPVTENVPEGVPKAAIVTWAAGSRAAPNGRNGKKMRRRTRKIAAALATIFVMSTIGTTTAVAQTSFYKASPYVDNKELVEAGSKSFDERLAIGEPESTPSAPVAASNLEDAILTGGLSPGKMEMPDMMLAGISGDEMALAAAADDSNPASDSAAAQPNQSGQAGQPGKGAPKDAGGNAGGASTAGDLAKSAADENPDGYASPALGGDPEPIMDEYAQDEGGPGGEPDAGQDPVPQTPANVELAGADTGADTGTDAGAEAPIEPTASGDGSHPEDGGPDETQPQSDELAVIPPPASDKSGSEEESYQTPPDPSGPTGVAPEEPSTDEPSTEEPSEVEGPRTTDQAPDDEPDGASEQAFADPSYTERDDEEPLADDGNQRANRLRQIRLRQIRLRQIRLRQIRLRQIRLKTEDRKKTEGHPNSPLHHLSTLPKVILYPRTPNLWRTTILLRTRLPPYPMMACRIKRPRRWALRTRATKRGPTPKKEQTPTRECTQKRERSLNKERTPRKGRIQKKGQIRKRTSPLRQLA